MNQSNKIIPKISIDRGSQSNHHSFTFYNGSNNNNNPNNLNKSPNPLNKNASSIIFNHIQSQVPPTQIIPSQFNQYHKNGNINIYNNNGKNIHELRDENIGNNNTNSILDPHALHYTMNNGSINTQISNQTYPIYNNAQSRKDGNENNMNNNNNINMDNNGNNDDDIDMNNIIENENSDEDVLKSMDMEMETNTNRKGVYWNGKYTCNLCKNKFKIPKGLLAHAKMAQFIHIYICDNCKNQNSDKYRSYKGTLKTQKMKGLVTTYQCIEKGCKNYGKHWNGPRACKAWLKHYESEHTSNLDFLNITDKHVCREVFCNKLIQKEQIYCHHHQEETMAIDAFNQNLDENGDDISTVIDNISQGGNIQRDMINKIDNAPEPKMQYLHQDQNGMQFNVYNALRIWTIQDTRMKESQKDVIITNLTDGIKKLAYWYTNKNEAIEGILKIRLLMPALYIDDIVKNKKSREKRKVERWNWYQKGYWKPLISQLTYIQDRIDEKRRQRAKRMDMKGKIKKRVGKRPPIKHNQSNILNNINPMAAEAGDTVYIAAQFDKLYNNARYEMDSKKAMKNRLEKCVHHARFGRWKRADAALNPGKLANLHNYNYVNSLKSKFPDGQKPQPTPPDPHMKYPLKYEESVKGILLSMNPQSSGGMTGINNDLILWGIKRQEKYGLGRALYNLVKTIYEKGLPIVLRQMFFAAKGVAACKAKAYDVRPIVICDGLVRIVDRLISASIEKKVRKAHVGQNQSIGIPRGCEHQTLAAELATKIIWKSNKYCIISEDVANAYNSPDRIAQHKLLKELGSPLLKYYELLYCHDNKIQFTPDISINANRGTYQGLSSSQYFFNIIKRAVHTRTTKALQLKITHFRKLVEAFFVDDGVIVVPEKMALQYLTELKKQYELFGLKMNINKSKIIMKVDDETKVDELKKRYSQFKLCTSGNFEHVGVPHGCSEYINTWVKDKLEKLYKKIYQITMIKQDQIKFNLLIKFCNYNKIIYIIKNIKYDIAWIKPLLLIMDMINRIILQHTNYKNTIKIQSQISIRNGGLGLRHDDRFVVATRLTTLSMKISDILRKYIVLDGVMDDVIIFKCMGMMGDDKKDEDDEKIVEMSKARREVRVGDGTMEVDETSRERMKEVEWMKQVIKTHGIAWTSEYNDLEKRYLKYAGTSGIKIAPEAHRELFDVLDRSLIKEFKNGANTLDLIRMNSMKTNGVSSWISTPVNNYYGQSFNNIEWYVAISLYLGCPVLSESQHCKKCNQEVNIYGHHALSCAKLGMTIKRHNYIRNILFKYVKMAGYRGMLEQRYLNSGILKVPGDIVIYDFAQQDIYLDVSIVNIYDKSYVNRAIKDGSKVLKQKVMEKIKKYNIYQDIQNGQEIERKNQANDEERKMENGDDNISGIEDINNDNHGKRDEYADKLMARMGTYNATNNIIPLIMDVNGSYCMEFKLIIQHLASRIAVRKQMPYSIIINRIRTHIISALYKYNAIMIQDCVDL